MPQHGKIDYLEFPASDLDATKQFFAKVFGWTFVDYGADYSAFFNAGIDGGIYRADLRSDSDRGAALAVFFSDALEQTQEEVLAAGGSIAKPIFEFPGGRRFHFYEPSGSEFAVASDKRNDGSMIA